MSTLAVIIPAYKPEFLQETLESLSRQTDKDFNVYIGDDNSPHHISEIVDRYKGRLNLTYKRFDENRGGQNLVSQWERCIDMSTEDWIWLFSDDDIMSDDCIEIVKRAINCSDKKEDVFRIDVEVIDRNGKKIKDVVYPKSISPIDMYKGKLLGRLNCYEVEYVFSRKIYEKTGGFVRFDLAWGSDLATWIKFSSGRNIITLDNAKVRWRSSGENISTIESKDIVDRKINALIEFLDWGERTFDNKRLRIFSDIGLAKRLLAFNITRERASEAINRFSIRKSRRYRILMLYLLGNTIKRITGK